MSGQIEKRLRDLGVELPQQPSPPVASPPVASYVAFARSGNLVFVTVEVDITFEVR